MSMSYSDVVAVLSFADDSALDLADAWLARLELEARGCDLLATFDARSSRRVRRALVRGRG